MKKCTVTWSKTILSLESGEIRVNREICASFAKEPLTWQPRHCGGCQGLAAAATGWLSEEGQAVLAGASRSSAHPLHTQAGEQKRQAEVRGCCPSECQALPSLLSVHCPKEGGHVSFVKNNSGTEDGVLCEMVRWCCTYSKKAI